VSFIVPGFYYYYSFREGGPLGGSGELKGNMGTENMGNRNMGTGNMGTGNMGIGTWNGNMGTNMGTGNMGTGNMETGVEIGDQKRETGNQKRETGNQKRGSAPSWKLGLALLQGYIYIHIY
jgi:hypothetical protein